MAWPSGIAAALALMVAAMAGRHGPPPTQNFGALQAIWTGHSYAYLLWPRSGPPCEVALFDGGSERTAAAISRTLRERSCGLQDIRHIFLTHGHKHHTAGARALHEAAVHVNMADGALARGDVGPRNLLMRLRHRLQAPQPLPRALEALLPGQRLCIGGHTIEVVGLPGHTEGSVAFALLGGLVAGDAIWGPSLCGAALEPYSARFADDGVTAQNVLGRVRGKRFAFIADGHNGIIEAQRCGETPPPP